MLTLKKKKKKKKKKKFILKKKIKKKKKKVFIFQYHLWILIIINVFWLLYKALYGLKQSSCQ